MQGTYPSICHVDAKCQIFLNSLLKKITVDFAIRIKSGAPRELLKLSLFLIFLLNDEFDVIIKMIIDRSDLYSCLPPPPPHTKKLAALMDVTK